MDWGWVGLGVVGLLIGVGALWGLLLFSLRTKYPPALAAIRRLNRALWNPRAMQTAGRPGASVSVVRHVGRVTGRSYQTPVVAVTCEASFVIALPYGTTPDWVRNVLAAGTATLVTQGLSVLVHRPEVVSSEDVDHCFSPRDRLVHRLYRVDHFLRLGAVKASVSRPR